MARAPVVNIDQLEFHEQHHGERFAARIASAARAVGARKLGYRLVIVPPGKRAWPYHAHHANEEMFFILEGEGTLRHAGEEYPVRTGDFIAAVADLGQPHQLINSGAAELKYLAVSTMEQPDVFVYPDSDKFGVFAGSAPGGRREERSFAFFGRTRDQRDYWDGEN